MVARYRLADRMDATVARNDSDNPENCCSERRPFDTKVPIAGTQEASQRADLRFCSSGMAPSSGRARYVPASPGTRTPTLVCSCSMT